MQENQIQSLGHEDLGEGNGNPLQYCCLGNPMDRSLVGYGPWGHKELDTTELLSVRANYLSQENCYWNKHITLRDNCFEEDKSYLSQ